MGYLVCLRHGFSRAVSALLHSAASAAEVRLMVETEREILREKDEETRLGERLPFESNRQATYEDSVLPKQRDERAWDYEDME